MHDVTTPAPLGRRHPTEAAVVAPPLPRRRALRSSSVRSPERPTAPRPHRRRAAAAVPVAAVLLLTAAGLGTGWAPARALVHRAAAAVSPDLTAAPPAEAGAQPLTDGPRLVDEAELHRAAAQDGLFYWAGPRRGTQLELTRTATGEVFVRYLPEGSAAGATDAVLTVATYPETQAVTLLQTAAAREGGRSWQTTTGAFVLVDPRAPSSAYFSFDGAPFQVEVFSPEPGAAQQLVLDGAVSAAGTGAPG